MELNEIKKTASWGDVATSINENFQKTSMEIESLKSSLKYFKGYFTSESRLKAKIPLPRVGDYAYVGNSYPGIVYACDVSGIWYSTGKSPADTPGVDLNDYAKKEETDTIKAQTLNNASDIGRLTNSVNTVQESGFHFPDSSGKDVMNYTDKGFDVAKVSAHLLSLILSTGVISEEMLSDEVKELINTLNLGEAPGTAYEGDKGKANADAIKILDASIKAMNNSLESVSFIMKVNEPGFHFPDSTGKDVMNYTEKGFDVAKISAHFLSLILATGVVTSDMLSDEVKKLIASSSGSADYLSSIILKVLESGYHFPDSTGKDVMNYTENGFDVAKVSSHFIEVLNSSGISGSLTYEIINDKIYNF